MADVFEDRDDHIEDRNRLWTLIELTSPWLVWQLLTKRPENVAGMTPWGCCGAWPSNVWIGTTVEDQRRAEERIPHLACIPAEVRFLSCEPLLGDVDLFAAGGLVYNHGSGWENAVDWVIVGGESGPKHRPLDLDAARSLRDQCQTAGVPFFFKQVGGRTPKAGGDLLDGRAWHEFPGVA